MRREERFCDDKKWDEVCFRRVCLKSVKDASLLCSCDTQIHTLNGILNSTAHPCVLFYCAQKPQSKTVNQQPVEEKNSMRICQVS